MLVQYDARHNQQQESAQLMAGSRHTQTNESTQCCLHTVMLYSQKLFPSSRLISIYTYIPAYFVRNSCELKRTKVKS